MLEQYIKALLYEQDCVVIPGFGAIVANDQSATIKEAKQTIAPPSKQLAFNESLKTNDGLLANYLADQENIAFARALRQIRETANEWKQRLAKGEVLHIDGVGRFRLNQEGNIVFNPEKQVNYNPQTFGLGEAQLVPVKRAPQTQKQEAEKATKSPLSRGKATPVLLGTASVGVIAVLLLFFLNISPFQFQRTDGPSASIEESINPGGNKEASSTSDTNREAEEADNEANKTLADNNKEETAKRNTHSEEKEEAEATENDNGNNGKNNEAASQALIDAEKEPKKTHESYSKAFHLVAGSFKKYSNAKSLASRAKRMGFDVEILKADNGFHRVSLEQYEDEANATDHLYRIRQHGKFQVWLLNNHKNQNS